MTLTVVTYLVYLLIAVPLTFWVATTLSRNGRAFLVDVFAGDDELPDAVNRLLVVGFYLVNLGFVTLYLRVSEEVRTVQAMVEVLSVKLGVVMLVLGALHLVNVRVFNTIRRRHRTENLSAASGPFPAHAPMPPDPGQYGPRPAAPPSR